MIPKHSTTLHGHRTSFSLEEPFWLEIKHIAQMRGMTLAALIAQVDDSRASGDNLSSALRVYVLDWLKAQNRTC